MAFWGIEVKPGKPHTHIYDGNRGSLRVSQATLGDGTATKRSVVQCNVGNNKPVLLCSLLPDRTESCTLDLRFKEDDEVVFSVVGPRSVHLTGYFLEESAHGGEDADDSDSYGEDIWEVGSEDSGSYSSQDDYESDFVDDGDIEMSPSVRPNSGVVIEEIIEDEKPKKVFTHVRHLKNKNLAGDSNEGEGNDERQIIVKSTKSSMLESEDEDGFPISSSNNVDNTNTLEMDKKRKFENISGKKDKINAVNNDKSKKKKDKVRSLKLPETDGELIGSGPTEDQTKIQHSHEKKAQEMQESSAIQDSRKLKKKKKDHIKVEQTSETSIDLMLGKSEDATNREQAIATNNVELANTENKPGAASVKKSKKKKKTKVLSTAENENKCSAVVEVDEESQRLNSGNGVSNFQGKMDGVEVNAEQSQNMDNGTVSKKKQENQLHVRNEAPRKPRTFANGLVIEELSMGQPDGKRASPGKTVSVIYTGKLRNGKIFDSNVGRKPFKFRLGVGQVIKGWDVGVDGMRIGDKRRLTIPPSMGYGAKGAGGQIPGNSWLIFDVELVDVK